MCRVGSDRAALLVLWQHVQAGRQLPTMVHVHRRDAHHVLRQRISHHSQASQPVVSTLQPTS